MKIDGRQAVGGTLVVAPGQQGEIQLPWGSFALVFNPLASPQNIRLTSTPPQILFDGTDNPLGIGTTLTVPLVTGQSKNLTLVVYSIGDSTTAYHIVHYTTS